MLNFTLWVILSEAENQPGAIPRCLSNQILTVSQRKLNTGMVGLDYRFESAPVPAGFDSEYGQARSVPGRRASRNMSREDRRQPDEIKLLEQARSFDPEALAWVYQTYHGAIYRYIYYHLGDGWAAEDLASDVFRRFLKAMRQGNGPTRQLSAWLYRVAHNLMVDELRRCKHRDHHSLDGTLRDTLKDRADSLDHLAGNAIAMEQLRDALLELTEDQRQVVVLRFLQGMSNAEVAEITGKTVGAVKALQHRGLDALRGQLSVPQEAVPVKLRGKWAPVPSSR